MRFVQSKSLILALFALATMTTNRLLHAEIPVGFEIIDIVSGNAFHHRPRINNCGEIVYYRGFPADNDSEIYYYDNGKLTKMTNNDVADSYPHTNDKGIIVWNRGADLDGNGDLCRLENGDLRIIGFGSAPRLNIYSHVVYEITRPVTCAFESDIYMFDGENTIRISGYDGRSNQGPAINDIPQVLWTSYDFSSCIIFDWTSLIQMYDDGMIINLPATLEGPQGVDINNLGHAVWSNYDHVEYWDGHTTRILTEGAVASLNDRGDVVFLRWTPYWVGWVYFEGGFYQITNHVPPLEAGPPDINNHGEVVLSWHYNGLTPVTSGITFMRRLRNGDVDFDRDIDLKDFKEFPACLTGPEPRDRLCDCRFLDMRHDRTVDLRDLAAFQNTYANPHNPAEGCCVPHDTSGCGDSDVAACVCAALPTCCSAAWTDPCVLLVELLGCGECP